MVFWNWAKGLEDTFDSKNRRQLHDFIVGKDEMAFDEKVRQDVHDDGAIVEDEVATDESDVATLYCLPHAAFSGEEKDPEGRRELGRVPLFAIFHRMANEKGVPHSFTRTSRLYSIDLWQPLTLIWSGFISQWPALPTFAIFLTVHVLPVAHVTVADRYVVNKIYALPGFYGASYYLGYRDHFGVEVNEIAEKIKELETRLNPNGVAELAPHLSALAASHTHMYATVRSCIVNYTHPSVSVPHYEILSRPNGRGKVALVINYIRTFLIEDVYARARIMFPETVNWIASPDRYALMLNLEF